MASVEAEDLEMKNNFRAAVEDAVDLDVGQPVETEDRVYTGFAYGNETNSSGAATTLQLNGGASLSVPNGATVRVKASGGNASAAYVGDSNAGSGSGYELQPGDSVELSVDDVSKLYVYLADTESVSWIVEQ